MGFVTYSWKRPDSLKKIEEFRKKKQVTWAHIEPTNACNFNCEWCYLGNSKQYDCMSQKNWKRAIDILSNSGIKQITFSGGEPLMYPDIVDCVKDAVNRGMVAHINTNGFSLSEELALKLVKAGLSQVQINIDSLNPAKHDMIRGKKGAFDKAVKAIKNTADAGIKRVSQTVLSKNNEGEIFGIIKFAKEELDMERCRVWDMTPSGNALQRPELYPEKYPKLLEKITEFTAGLGAKHVLSYEPLFPLDYKPEMDVTHVGCPSKGVCLNVSPKGDVKYCAMLSNSLYNIFDYKDITDIHKEKLEEFNNKLSYNEKCTSCKHFPVCRGGCLPRAIKSKDNMDFQCVL